MKKKIKVTLVLLPFVFFVFLLAFPQQSESAYTPLSNVKDTLSTSRLSFVGTVETGNSTGSTVLTIKTSSLPSWATSDSNINLFTGDTLAIGATKPYTVVDINDSDKIQLNRALEAVSLGATAPVIATRSARHTLTFTPVSVLANGKYRIRIKATASSDGSDSSTATDGIPDADGFDFGESFNTSWIDCSSADSGSASIQYSDEANCPSGYTCIFCTYSGSNTLAQKTIQVGTTASAQQPINPAPSSTSKTAGAADTYSFYVDHMDNGDNIINSTWGKIAVVESVRVTAVVEPTIEFTITSVSTGATACGEPMDVTTTAVTVPFGTVAISDFVDAAQELSCATNAGGGYAITAIESDQLSLITSSGLDTGTQIADTSCDAGDTCTTSDDGDWNTPASSNGFGYSLDDDGATDGAVDTMLFEYDDTINWTARPFPSTEDGDSAVQIMASTAETDTQDAYVCYRITVGSTQQAGTYENAVTYVASATF